MLAKSEIYQLLSQLPEEALAAILILSLIFTFLTTLVTVMCVADSYKTLKLARMSKELIEDLLAKGYTPQEIEPLVNGPHRWQKMRQLFASLKNRMNHRERPFRHPAPPVKRTTV